MGLKSEVWTHNRDIRTRGEALQEIVLLVLALVVRD